MKKHHHKIFLTLREEYVSVTAVRRIAYLLDLSCRQHGALIVEKTDGWGRADYVKKDPEEVERSEVEHVARLYTYRGELLGDVAAFKELPNKKAFHEYSVYGTSRPNPWADYVSFSRFICMLARLFSSEAKGEPPPFDKEASVKWAIEKLTNVSKLWEEEDGMLVLRHESSNKVTEIIFSRPQ